MTSPRGKTQNAVSMLIEARIDKLKRDHVRAESLLYHPPGGGIGSLAVSPSKTDFASGPIGNRQHLRVESCRQILSLHR